MTSVLDTVLDRSVLGGYPKWGLTVRKRLRDWPADPPAGAMTGRHAFVTGAGGGLGAATAAALARLGATVHLVVRDEKKCTPGPNTRVWRCDVSDLADVRRFAAAVVAEGVPVDVLVHNAGVLPAERRTTAQGHELTLATHVLGPLLMTSLLRPGRAIFVSSGGMYTQGLPLDDPEYVTGRYRGAVAYARSKRIQVAIVPALACRWPDITVAATHPGWADTPGLAGSLPGFRRVAARVLRSAEEGADTTVWLAATDPAPPTGLFWHDRHPRPAHLLPWTRHDDEAAASTLSWCLAHLA